MIRSQNLNLAIGDRIQYAYDIANNWPHLLEMEDKLAADAEALYPRCVGGERSTPTEDVGESRATRSSLRRSSIPATRSASI